VSWVSAGDIKKRGAPRRSMPIFFTLSQANARRLQDVAGGDEARVNFLTTALGQQLVGRPGLTPTQQNLLQVCPQLDAQQQWACAVDITWLYLAKFSLPPSTRISSSKWQPSSAGSNSYSGQYSRLSRGRPGFNSPIRRILLSAGLCSFRLRFAVLSC